MNHLLKKLNFAGAGKKSKPDVKPASLVPPVLGDHTLASSYSFSETLDLISDGPIAGLCNKNGYILNDNSILQGIYLDNTPIAESNDFDAIFSHADSYLDIENINPPISVDVESSVLTNFRANLQFFTGLGDMSMYSNKYDISYYPKRYTKLNNYGTLTISTNAKGGDYITAYNNNGGFTTKTPNNFGTQTFISNKTVGFLKNGHIFNVYMFGNLGIDQTFLDAVQRKKTLPSLETDAAKIDFYFKLIGAEVQNLINKYQNGQNSYEKDYAEKKLKQNFGADALTYISDVRKLISKGHFFRAWTWMAYKIPINNLNGTLPSVKSTKIENDTKTADFEVVFLNDSNESLIGDKFYYVYDLTVPNIDNSGTIESRNGKSMTGCMLLLLPINTDYTYWWSTNQKRGANGVKAFAQSTVIPISTYQTLLNLFNKIKFRNVGATAQSFNNLKYNFSNILAEYKDGSEFQTPFNFFNKVFIDKFYNSALIGPFNKNGEVARIAADTKMNNFVDQTNPGFTFLNANTTDNKLQNTSEGSNDSRGTKNFSDWNTATNSLVEKSIPVIHTIDNPNVDKVYITLQINELNDTIDTALTAAQGPNKKTQMDLGTKYPSILNISVELGYINDDGLDITTSSNQFQFVALVQSPCMIDIGNEDNLNYNSDYKFIRSAYNNNDISKAFILPILNTNNLGEITNQKRFVKITRLSMETNSTLIRKDVDLVKVTEIISCNLRYPYSAIIGTKIDSRSFRNIPTKTFHCKLKKVKIPSNYDPCFNGSQKDKRYYNSITELPNDAAKEDKLIYNGDWDGTFKSEPEWTDNPAWILYDLLTSTRYGLGQHIDSEKINIWDLYSISKFCDAVDDDGYFVGVSDGKGGLEPRFSCNVLFQQSEKIFDAINIIASLFRGSVYYYNSEINFVDDRPKLINSFFSNINVKDGLFNYANNRRDEQFNTVEVVYIDRFDNFRTKVEYVEDEEDIRKRGVFKKTINAIGVTSRMMARRMAQHIIYQTIKENQSITFTAGLESLLCRPGDLIIIEDELKSLKSNFGKILSIDYNKKSIRLNESFESGAYNNLLSIYTPTGRSAYITTGDDISQSYDQLSGLKQITTFSATGIVLKDYGCEVFLNKADINTSLLSVVEPGSPYRFQIKNSDDKIFKVISIKEENLNEYVVIATKYDTGKYKLIENLASVEYAPATYAYQVAQTINNTNVPILSAPKIQSLETGYGVSGFYISGSWRSNDLRSTSYNVNLINPNGIVDSQITSNTNALFYNNGLGNYVFEVQAKSPSNSYANSSYDASGVFIIYNGTSLYYDRSFMKNIYID